VRPERFIYLHQSLSNSMFRHHRCSRRSYVRNAPRYQDIEIYTVKLRCFYSYCIRWLGANGFRIYSSYKDPGCHPRYTLRTCFIQIVLFLIKILGYSFGRPYYQRQYDGSFYSCVDVGQCPIPEPSTIGFLGLGALGVLGFGKYRKQRKR